MSLRTPGLHVEIAVSNMDLYPVDLPGRASWTSNLEQLEPYLERTGFRNYEVHPTETIVRDVKARKVSGDTEIVDQVVGSLHETFNNGEGILGRVADRCGVYRQLRSIGGMMTIQSVLSRPVPSVHYFESGGIRLQPGPMRRDFPWFTDTPWAEQEYPGSFPIAQPCAEFYERYGIGDEQHFELRLGSAMCGAVGQCPDVAHERRQSANGTKMPRLWDVWMKRFSSGSTYEMHAACDRFDMKHRDPTLAATSVAEFKAFTSRYWKKALYTEMGQMVVAAIENYVPPEDLLTVTGIPVLRSVTEVPPRPEAILRREAQHARFAENLVNIVQHAGATPLMYGDVLSRSV